MSLETATYFELSTYRPRVPDQEDKLLDIMPGRPGWYDDTDFGK